jgi:hypothetical protein
MRGVWSWSDKDRTDVLKKLKTPHILRILTALKETKGGLSNAEVDSLLRTASQWVIFWDLRELIALDIVKFDVQLFGEPGKYHLTDSGLSVIEELEKGN